MTLKLHHRVELKGKRDFTAKTCSRVAHLDLLE
jgi:hypothetical protein